MTLDPLVSIIIPAYNPCPSDLERAIRSVLVQTYSAVEIIVVDDGSADGTAMVCREFGNQIRYVYQENAGVSAARNRGIREAKGEYIGFLDADDWYLPNKLTDMMAALEFYPDAVALTSNFQDFYCSENRYQTVVAGVFREDIKYVEISIFDYLANGVWVVHTNSVVIKKCVFDLLGGFDEALKFGEDLELWSRIGGRYKWIFVNRICSVYWQDSESSVTSVTPLDEHGFGWLYPEMKMRRHIKKNERRSFRLFRQLCCFSRIGIGFRSGNRSFVWACLVRMFPTRHIIKYFFYIVAFCLPTRFVRFLVMLKG